jgi:mannosyl-oligosaccharide glucosidase
MAMYGWTTYDVRTGGTQIIQDVGNQIDISTEFIKKSEGQSAGNWALRIKGKLRKDAPADLKTSVVFYVGMEAMESCADCQLEAFEQLGAGEDKSVQAVNFAVKHSRLGSAGIHIPSSVGENGRHEGTIVHSLNVTEDRLWQAKCEYNLSGDRNMSFPLHILVYKLTILRGRSHFPGLVESSVKGSHRSRSDRCCAP